MVKDEDRLRYDQAIGEVAKRLQSGPVYRDHYVYHVDPVGVPWRTNLGSEETVELANSPNEQVGDTQGDADLRSCHDAIMAGSDRTLSPIRRQLARVRAWEANEGYCVLRSQTPMIAFTTLSDTGTCILTIAEIGVCNTEFRLDGADRPVRVTVRRNVGEMIEIDLIEAIHWLLGEFRPPIAAA